MKGIAIYDFTKPAKLLKATVVVTSMSCLTFDSRLQALGLVIAKSEQMQHCQFNFAYLSNITHDLYNLKNQFWLISF